MAQVTDVHFDLAKIKKISLVDGNGQSHPLTKDIFKPLNLFVFLSPECPLCKNYTTVLNKISQDFSLDSFVIIGIVYKPAGVLASKAHQDSSAC